MGRMLLLAWGPLMLWFRVEDQGSLESVVILDIHVARPVIWERAGQEHTRLKE